MTLHPNDPPPKSTKAMSGASEARDRIAKAVRDGGPHLHGGAAERIVDHVCAALTAPSAGTGEGTAAVYEECARIADAYAAQCKKGGPASSMAEDLWGASAGRDIAAAIRSAAPSPSRPEPTREEYAKALYKSRNRSNDQYTDYLFSCVDHPQFDADYKREVEHCYRDADAVLALLGRAGKECEIDG